MSETNGYGYCEVILMCNATLFLVTSLKKHLHKLQAFSINRIASLKSHTLYRLNAFRLKIVWRHK